MESLRSYLPHWLHSSGYPWLDSLVLVLAMLLTALVVDKINHRFLVNVLRQLLDKSSPHWFTLIERHQVLDKLARLVPMLVIYWLLPYALFDMPALALLLQKLCVVVILIRLVLFIYAVLDLVTDRAEREGVVKRMPVKSFIQLTKLFVFFIIATLVISTLLDKSPLFFLSGLGALTAVLLLVFKDTILGFVAGVQLAANRMVGRGDWIEMPKYGADGEVLEVALTTVKVQNWDKTITMIPTYALISDSFKNWRGMEESGGRRIKRAIHIDLNTVGFLSQADLDHLMKVDCIADYLRGKRQEIDDDNRQKGVDISVLANGRKLTNIGTFRAYLEFYLRNHPMVNQQMTLLVRQLAPTQHGLPIEIYLFCNDIRWAAYEAVQADIFDHLFAILGDFGLRAYQQPAGSDWRQLSPSRPVEQ